MMANPKPPDQSFWKDEPDLQAFPSPFTGVFMSVFKVYRLLFAFASLALCFGISYLISPILAWFWLAGVLFSYGFGIRLRRQRKLEMQEIVEVQARAASHLGASLVGSAVHVAGHPQLEREQNVVLALTFPNLSVYSYASDQPLVIIPLQQIVSIQTVVYDDDRVPHVDVVDSTAQAIQLILKYDQQEIACLFRRMKKVRPIDWYHAIQKARSQ
jgi:hypothetical protein